MRFYLPHVQLEIFNELARIFSEDNNAFAQREVLMREGTAKFADTAGENDRHLQKVFQRQVSETRQNFGVIRNLIELSRNLISRTHISVTEQYHIWEHF